jgi:DNA-binding transcriptional LysR family regulator
MGVDTLTSIKVFRQVVESGTFVAAAERMDLSTAMVSKHIAQVEKRLGVRLLNRNTRALSLTEPGRVYFERCKTILDDLEATELEMGSLGTAPRGTLRVTCPSWFARQRMADVVADFRRSYPEILVDMSFEDRFVDLVEEGYDLALRVTHPGSLPPGLVARAIRSIPVLIAASREYLKLNGTPQSPEELAHHDFIAVRGHDSITFIGPKEKIEVPVRVALRYRSVSGAAHAVAAGIGLSALPETFFEDPLLKSVLTPVLTDYPLEDPKLYVVYVSRTYLPLKIRTFVDFFMQQLAAVPPATPA